METISERIEKLKKYHHKLIDKLLKLYIYEESSKYIDKLFEIKLNDFKSLDKLRCLDMSNRDYLIVSVMDQYKKHVDKESLKEDLYRKICNRYDLYMDEKTFNKNNNSYFKNKMKKINIKKTDN